MTHTEQFNEIMKRNTPAKKAKQQPVTVKLIGARENMNPMQTDLSKCEISGNVVSLPREQLPNYSEVRTALLNAGAKYSRSKFIFPNDAEPYIERLMGGENVNIKKEFQFYATPPDLAKYLISIAIANGLNVDSEVLEPSAGQGALMEAIQERVELVTPISCFELMDINRGVLVGKLNAGLYGSLRGFDFLEYDGSLQWDFIIANPPFNKNQDIQHIRKMFEVCKPGGTIITIASTHWQHSINKKEVEFREWVQKVGKVEDINSGAFKASGTMVRSCIVIIKKQNFLS